MTTVTAVPLQPVKRGYLVWLWLGIALAVIVAAALVWAAPRDAVETALAANRRQDSVVQTPSGLQYQVLKKGAGNTHPSDEDVALIQYVGKLTDGTVFDQSQRPTPLPVAQVVPGFSEGLKLMTKGAKYRFWIKPSLGYGDKAAGPIPANSLLVFDVELVDFLPESYIRQMQAMQAQMGAGGAGGGAAAPGEAAPPAP